MVQNVVLTDFESGSPLPVRGGVTASNSPATGNSDTLTAVVSESGSQRLLITDSNGGVNGAYMTFTTAFSEPGFYLITADIKVQNSVGSPINTYGMAARVGGTATSKINDVNAGYVLNLSDYPTNAATLGYQTIGAGIDVPAGGTFPKQLTLYFSTDPSSAPTHTGRGDFSGSHRGSAASLAGSNSNQIYVDNIRKIGPGNRGEERHMWISIGDQLTNLSKLESNILQAKANGFNCIDLLVRYRTNRYYINNRDFNTYPNNEPGASGVTSSNDPLQYAIDRCRQLNMKVFVAVSCFLTTDGGGTYPSSLPAGSITYMYNGGSPVPQTTTNDSSGLWADMGRADVRRHVLDVTMDIVQNYDIDGVIFDRIRYQGNEFGYNPVALAEMGYTSPPSPTDTGFRLKRQQAIAKFLHDAYEEITTLKPWVIVGTVPIAYGASFTDTYNRVYQSFPLWSKQISANRNITFGSQDNIQPQFYRQWDQSGYEAPNSNRTLINLGTYGAISTDAMDYGLMPGSNVIYAPLFYSIITAGNETDAANTAAALAANFCDTRNFPAYFTNGFGFFSAKLFFEASEAVGTTMASRVRAVSTTPCGTDILSSVPEFPDYLMKKGYDNTAPLAVTGLTATGGYFTELNWTASAPAADGESASWYEIYRSTNPTVALTYANRINRTQQVTSTFYRDEQIPANGNYYYAVVAVDDYNNKSAAVTVGPVTVQSGNVIVESRTAAGGVTPAAQYVETGTFANSTAKSLAPYLSGSGSRYTTNIGAKAKFIPNLPLSGYYNVYVTMLGNPGNNSANAAVNYSLVHGGGTKNGTVQLTHANTDLNSKWLLLEGSTFFNAGTAGNIELTFSGLGSAGGNRFVSDAVRFEFVSTSVEDWSVY